MINIFSALGTRPLPVGPIYSMAKASINNLTHALAMELGSRRITVNAVAPGWVKNRHECGCSRKRRYGESNLSRHCLGARWDNADITPVVAFLASGAGRWITAQVIEASDGYKL